MVDYSKFNLSTLAKGSPDGEEAYKLVEAVCWLACFSGGGGVSKSACRA